MAETLQQMLDREHPGWRVIVPPWFRRGAHGTGGAGSGISTGNHSPTWFVPQWWREAHFAANLRPKAWSGVSNTIEQSLSHRKDDKERPYLVPSWGCTMAPRGSGSRRT